MSSLIVRHPEFTQLLKHLAGRKTTDEDLKFVYDLVRGRRLLASEFVDLYNWFQYGNVPNVIVIPDNVPCEMLDMADWTLGTVVQMAKKGNRPQDMVRILGGIAHRALVLLAKQIGLDAVQENDRVDDEIFNNILLDPLDDLEDQRYELHITYYIVDGCTAETALLREVRAIARRFARFIWDTRCANVCMDEDYTALQDTIPQRTLEEYQAYIERGVHWGCGMHPDAILNTIYNHLMGEAVRFHSESLSN